MSASARAVSLAVVLLWAPACSVRPLDLTDFACETDGTCATGYSCDAVSNVCITAGDLCAAPGAVSPCVFGEKTCAGGCRTCSAGAWSECETGGDTCDDRDGDGLGNGSGGNINCVDTTDDVDDTDPGICADTDGDGCDDCSHRLWDPENDGSDADADGICDTSDDCTDVDGDGFGNGNLGNTGCVPGVPTDVDDGDPSACADTESVRGAIGDGCDDCSSGVFDPSTDGADADGDSVCDASDWCAANDDTLCGTSPACNASLEKLILTCVSPGNCNANIIASCDDGDPCTADTCDADPSASADCTHTQHAAGHDCGCGICDAAGACNFDASQDGNCGTCEQCVMVGACGPQASGDDLKGDCPADACNLGTCDGNGACGFATTGTGCDVCGACDGAGTCAYDDARDADCNTAPCQQCSALGACGDQAPGTDLNADCDDGLFCNGDEICGAGGVCDPTPPGDPCVGVTCIEARDVCGCTDEFDCGVCEECVAGTCVNQGGTDLKAECGGPLDTCNLGCNGGSCTYAPATTPCGTGVCRRCDGAGSCQDDVAQNGDCPALCQQCGAGGVCVGQNGTDINNDCPVAVGDCTDALCDAGGGACASLADGTSCTACASGTPCNGCLTGTCQDCILGDGDSDSVCDDSDNCVGVWNPAPQLDSDGDGVGDACDLCPGFDDTRDWDNDGTPDDCDACQGWEPAGQICNGGDCGSACDGAGACVGGFANRGEPCRGSDALWCNSSCDGSGTCADGLAASCDDNCACSADNCGEPPPVAACTHDFKPCSLSLSNTGPTSQRTLAQVTVDAGCAGQGAAIVCATSVARLCINDPERFETGLGGFSGSRIAPDNCGGNNVTSTNCVDDDGGNPDVMRLMDNGSASAWIGGIDATGFTTLRIHFRAAFDGGADWGEDIYVGACCGAGCTTSAVGSALNATSGGTDAWIERGPFSPGAGLDNCSNVRVNLTYSTSFIDEDAQVDNFAVSGIGARTLGLTDNGDGTYTTTPFAACAATSVTVTCTWDTPDGTFTGSTDVVFN